MVGLIQRWFCRKQSALAVENEELKRIITTLIPFGEKHLDNLIDIHDLKQRLGNGRPYAGVS